MNGVRPLLFSRRTTNPFPAVFTVLIIALHELLISEDRKISDFEAIQGALADLDKRIETSRGSTRVEERRQNVNTIKGLIADHLVPAEGRALYDDQSATDIDGAIRRSEIEAPHYELKQGVLRLDSLKQLDVGMLDKIIQTTCAIANNGPKRSGLLLLGVADSEGDKERVEELYEISSRPVGRKYVVGVRREAEALGESMETYFGRIKAAFEDSELSEPLKSAVLAGIGFNDYFGMGILVINIPSQSEVSTVGDIVFVRKGDTTRRLDDNREILEVARRF